jgi:ABC-type uncharacterized transport system involved in gliding motility auxiliary subunit
MRLAKKKQQYQDYEGAEEAATTPEIEQAGEEVEPEVPTSGEHLVFAFNANLLQNATDELKDAEAALKKAE